MTLTDITNNIPAVTALVVAVTGLVGALVAGWVKLKGISTKQDATIASSAARDVLLGEVHAAIVPASPVAIPVTVAPVETKPAPTPEVKS